MTNTIGATPEERELIEALKLHAFDDCGGQVLDTHIAIQAATTLESLISDRAKLREDDEWLPTVRYCIDKALSGEPTRDSLLIDLRNLRAALNQSGQSNGE